MGTHFSCNNGDRYTTTVDLQRNAISITRLTKLSTNLTVEEIKSAILLLYRKRSTGLDGFMKSYRDFVRLFLQTSPS